VRVKHRVSGKEAGGEGWNRSAESESMKDRETEISPFEEPLARPRRKHRLHGVRADRRRSYAKRVTCIKETY